MFLKCTYCRYADTEYICQVFTGNTKCFFLQYKINFVGEPPHGCSTAINKCNVSFSPKNMFTLNRDYALHKTLLLLQLSCINT